MVPQSQLDNWVSIIRSVESDCMIGFMDNEAGISSLLSVGQTGSRCAIVIELINYRSSGSIEVPVYPPNTVVRTAQVPASIQQRSVILNRDRRTSEVAGAVFSCTGAAMSGYALSAAAAATSAAGALGAGAGAAGVAGTAAAGVVATYLSVGLLAVAAIGTVASALTCFNGVYRTSESVVNPDSNSLEQLEGNSTYSNFFLGVDAVGLATAVIGLGPAANSIYTLLRTRAMLAGRSAAAIRAAIERMVSTPAGRTELETAIRSAGGLTGASATTMRRILSGRLGDAPQRAERLMRSIDSVFTERLLQSLGSTAGVRAATVVGAGMGVVGSASPAYSRSTGLGLGAASGVLHAVCSPSDASTPSTIATAPPPMRAYYTLLLHAMDL